MVQPVQLFGGSLATVWILLSIAYGPMTSTVVYVQGLELLRKGPECAQHMPSNSFVNVLDSH